MKKFINSQVKNKEERREEKEISRQEKLQEKSVRDAEKAEVLRQNGMRILDTRDILEKPFLCLCSG